jgi:hypothetical protein
MKTANYQKLPASASQIIQIQFIKIKLFVYWRQYQVVVNQSIPSIPKKHLGEIHMQCLAGIWLG